MELILLRVCGQIEEKKEEVTSELLFEAYVGISLKMKKEANGG